NNPGKAFNKIIEGPWYHDQWFKNDGTHHGNIPFGSNTSEYYQQHFEIPFFNYFLLGKGDISQIAEANIFVTGANEWRSFAQWPPANKEDKTIYVHPNGRLEWYQSRVPLSKVEKQEVRYSEYTSDPDKPVPYEEDIQFNRS